MLVNTHIAFYFPRQNLNANHRANDWVILEGVDQCLSARFMYGPLDMVSLSNEKVKDLSFSPNVNGVEQLVLDIECGLLTLICCRLIFTS